MNVSAETLIGSLPPYQDEWITIHANQEVKHIMREVCEAHDEFAPYYDKIALYFDADSTKEICENLYTFLKNNIRYQEESEDEQTTALPTGILVRRKGDCKHYSGFSAGILDALNRTGKKIKWCYCFASYKPFVKTPHHVFVKVFDNREEIWIDPTPGADNKEPEWMIDKKITAMPLHRNISGTSIEEIEYNPMYVDGEGQMTEKGPHWQLMGMPATRGADGNFGTNPYFTGPFLGLQHYKEDPYSIEGTDWNVTSDDLQARSGIDWEPDFVKWIYENSMKFWNFLYPHGVEPGYTPAVALPTWYPKPVITDDYRLTFDRDHQVDDYMNNEIQALTAWIQDIINTNDTTPFPLKTRDVKLFSQNNTGMPGNPNANLFNEHRGAGFVKDVLKKIEHAINKVKQGVFKVGGAALRNPFLGLVGINFGNFATNMWKKIEAGQWEKMKKKWERLGGNADKLLNTIKDGKDKNAILGSFDDDYENTIGEPATTASLVALAAPIIAAMLAFIKDDEKREKVQGVLKATKDFFASKYPEIDFNGFAFLDRNTGEEIDWVVDDIDNENSPYYVPGAGDLSAGGIMNWIQENPIIAIGGGGLLIYLLNSRGKKVSGHGDLRKVLLPLGIALAIWFLLKKCKSGTGIMHVDEMRDALSQWKTDKSFLTALNSMSENEVAAVYDYVFNYLLKGIKPDPGSPLESVIKAINEKYQIFD